MACEIPLPSMDWQSTNLPKDFDRFVWQVMLHFNWPLKDFSGEVKVNYLLLWSGIEGQNLSDTFEFEASEARNIENYIEKFHAYIEPRPNFRVSRYQLLQCRQQPDEPAHAFLKRLRQIMKQWEYDPPIEKTLLVNIFIFGLNLKFTQKSLLKEGNNLSIAEALHVTETEEATLKQVEAIQNTQSALQIPEEKTQDAHAIKAGREYYNNSYFCGKGHYRDKCPAKGKSCGKCWRTGHFAVTCRTRDMKASTRKRDGPPRSTKTRRNRNAHNITTPSNEEDNHSPTEAYFHTISGP